MKYTLRADLEALYEAYGEDLVNAEVALEERMVALGRDQVRKNIDNARQHGNESGTGYGKTLVAMSVDTLKEGITEFVAKAETGGAGRRHIAVKYFKQVDWEVVAFIAMRTVVDGLTGRSQLVQRIAIQIGSRIEDEARFTQFKKENNKMFTRGKQRAVKGTSYHRKKATLSGYERRFTEQEWVSWPEHHLLHIGAALVDMIVATGLVEIAAEITSRKHTNKVLVPSAKLAEWIENEVAKSEFLTPSHMPMVVPPLKWSNPFNGGYLTKETQKRAAMVKSKNRSYMQELADKAETMPMVYDSLNALQNTRWKINSDVLAVVESLWEQGEPQAKLPSREDIDRVACPCCAAPIGIAKLNTRGKEEHKCFEDAEVLRQWKKSAHVTHTKNVSLRSKRLVTAKTLKVARIYAEHEAMYFPYQLDFRGRVYAIPTFNPQGADLTKGLLTFADAKPIEDGVAAGWLAIHGANVWGFDKASLEDRIGWVEDHADQIMEAATNPMSYNWWQDADKPWQFLSFCFEWAGFMTEGYGYMSSLPVALDGTCSGIQHFSAMLRDSVGGSAVNLLPADKPADIYQEVCNRAVAKLKTDAAELTPTIAIASPLSQKDKSNTEATAIATAELANAWLGLNPDRSSTKRQVMTLPYGATRFSCRAYTEEWMRDRAGDDMPFEQGSTFQASQYMSEIIWESIGEVVVAAREAMDWLQSCAKVVADEGLPVYWTTPLGFTVMQKYNSFKSRRVETRLGDKVVKLSLQHEQDNIDKRRMASAISPNFVHSLDATHLMMSVCYAEDNGIESFAMIHDSFGTHAADTNMLAACLREAFVNLYEENDVLEDFKAQIERQVEPENQERIPALPAKGDLDVACVRDSDFFFA